MAYKERNRYMSDMKADIVKLIPCALRIHKHVFTSLPVNFKEKKVFKRANFHFYKKVEKVIYTYKHFSLKIKPLRYARRLKGSLCVQDCYMEALTRNFHSSGFFIVLKNVVLGGTAQSEAKWHNAVHVEDMGGLTSRIWRSGGLTQE